MISELAQVRRELSDLLHTRGDEIVEAILDRLQNGQSTDFEADDGQRGYMDSRNLVKEAIDYALIGVERGVTARKPPVPRGLLGLAEAFGRRGHGTEALLFQCVVGQTILNDYIASGLSAPRGGGG